MKKPNVLMMLFASLTMIIINSANSSAQVDNTRAAPYRSSEGMAYQNQYADSGEFRIYSKPAFSTSTISFFLPESQHMVISITDMSGRVVSVVSEIFYQGENELQWFAGELANGIYYLRIQSASISETERIIVAR